VIDSPEGNEPTIVDNPLQDIIKSEDLVDNVQVPIDNSVDTQDKPIKKTNREYIDIVKEYNNKLESLRGTFEIELNELVSQGFEEYSKGNTSSTTLANKLLSAGSKLE